MRRRAVRIAAAILAALLLAAAGAVLAGWLYDRSRDDVIAQGVVAAGVDIGGLHAAAARERLRAELLPPLERPIRLDYGARSFRIGAADAAVQVDLDAMV